MGVMRLWGSLCGIKDLLVCKSTPPHRGQEETKERGRPSRLEGSSFNKQGDNLSLRFTLPKDKATACLRHLPTKILAVYIFNYVISQDGLSNILFSHFCIFEDGSYCENVRQNIHSKDRERESLQLLRSRSRVN